MTARRSSRTGAGPAIALPGSSVQPSPWPGRGGTELRLGGIALTTPNTERDQIRHRHHRFRLVRRLAGVLLALALLTTAGVAGLMLITPSVGNAPALAQAFDRAHHATYPGPPVPARFATALVASQDQRFYTEAGLSPVPIADVLIGHLAGGSGLADQGRSGQGGTIAQKLARILYLSTRSGLLADEEQVLLGMKLTYSYSRARLLRIYADVMYFGRGYYGVTAASCGYFAERPADLSWGQAATLVAIAQAPVTDDPIAHLLSARAAEATVLAQLTATGKLTRAQQARAYNQPLDLARSHPGRARCATGP